MIATLTERLSRLPWPQISWSALVALVAAAVVLLLWRLPLRRRAGTAPRKPPPRFVLVGIAFLLLLVLCEIWGLSLLGRPGDEVNLLLQNIVWTVAAAAILFMLVRAAQHGLIRRATSIEDRHKARVVTAWIGVVLFFIVAALIWASGVKDLGIFLGIIGAGVALSMQETLLCVAGWLLLVARRVYDIGDRVEIDGRIGDVIDISVFQTSMLEVGKWVQGDQSTGRMLIIPNSMVIRGAVYNYSKGFPFVWDEFSTVVTFESDWEAARDLMLEQAEVEAEKIEAEVKRQIEKMQHRYAIRYEHLQPIIYTSIADHGVQLTLRYLTPIRKRRHISHVVCENVLRVFLKHPKIDFAYPTKRIFRNNEEGKSDLGGPNRS